MSESDMKKELSSRFKTINESGGGIHGDFIAQSSAAYEKMYKRKMPEASKAILQSSFNQMTDILIRRDGKTKEQIMSATADISQVNNPITLLFNLMSILIPNFAYTLLLGLQPLPTKDSPIFYPQITANEDRNTVTKGTSLLGSTNWNQSHNYSTNKSGFSDTLSAGSDTISFNVDENNIRAGSVVVELRLTAAASAPVFLFDNGEGSLTGAEGFVKPGATVNYATGTVNFELETGATAWDSYQVTYRYDMDAVGHKPAQAVLEWVSRMVRAEPYRLRSTYSLDNFYQVKQVLSGYNIDQVLSTSLAGIINKEVSGSVFDDALMRTDADFVWDSNEPTGVPWAMHRLSLLQTFVRGGNGIRQQIARSGGNVAICGNEWMNFIETLGEDVWKPIAYSAGEPIGPYEAGDLLGRFKIIKNQDYPDQKVVMGYKKDDTDASMLGGVFIGLYSTNPIAMDDLNVIQGMGTQVGWVKSFDNSLVSLTMT
jgi:hypothetical protein